MNMGVQGRIRFRVFVVTLVLLLHRCRCYNNSNQPPPPPPPTRRQFLPGAMTAAAFLNAFASTPFPAMGVLSSKYCASGIGDGCQDLSEGNDFIKSLQEKSAANKEKNTQVPKP